MSRKHTKPPFVERDQDLLSSPLYRIQWMITRNLPMREPKMSRRKLLDEMSKVFSDAGFEVFPYRNGGYYELPDIDDVFGNDDEMRSFSHYLEADESGFCPRRMSRKPERLKLLNLYLKLRYPRLTRYLETKEPRC